MTTDNIDSNNLLPLYFRVYKSLLGRIQRGEFPPGIRKLKSPLLLPANPLTSKHANSTIYSNKRRASFQIGIFQRVHPFCNAHVCIALTTVTRWHVPIHSFIQRTY